MTTKIAILSNIYANVVALEAVLNNIKNRNNINLIINCGNFLPKGPTPAEVSDIILNNKNIISVLGPLDKLILDRPHPALDIKGYFISEDWTISQLGIQKVIQLKNLKEYLLYFNNKISISYNLLYEKFDDAEILIIGGALKPFKENYCNKIILSPGIVGYSHEFIANYAIFDIDTLDYEIISLEYDKNKLLKYFESRNIPDKQEILKYNFGIFK